MTTLLYPDCLVPATSDRRQASLGGYKTLKRLKAALETPLRLTCMAITAAPAAHVCGPGMAWVWGVLLVAVGVVQAGRVASGLLNYVCMRGAIFCSLSPVLVFQGRWTSSRRPSPFLRPSVPESPLPVARLVWMPSKIAARECLNDCDYVGLSNSTTLQLYA